MTTALLDQITHFGKR